MDTKTLLDKMIYELEAKVGRRPDVIFLGRKANIALVQSVFKFAETPIIVEYCGIQVITSYLDDFNITVGYRPLKLKGDDDVR